MTDTLNRPKPRSPYRFASPKTWETIQRRYLAGESARVLAETYDISVYSIRRRIWKGGWTKRAAAEAATPEPADAVLTALTEEVSEGRATPIETAKAALNEAVRLARQGKMALAVEAARVADLMTRTALRLNEAFADPLIDEVAAKAEARARLIALAGEAQ